MSGKHIRPAKLLLGRYLRKVFDKSLSLRKSFRPFLFEDQHELNRTNALGLRGLLAQAYSMFMRKLWHGSYDRISPAKIRDLISEKYSQFSGFEQHDAQEFMNALLSLLHEDLNRIEKRPYFEPIDGNGWDDKRLADESWRLFLSRDDSVIVDNFYGQFKSKLTCPECNKVSISKESQKSSFKTAIKNLFGFPLRFQSYLKHSIAFWCQYPV